MIYQKTKKTISLVAFLIINVYLFSSSQLLAENKPTQTVDTEPPAVLVTLPNPSASFQDEHPLYIGSPLDSSSSLQIPHVDTIDQSGSYLDAYFSFDQSINAWRLASVKELTIDDQLVKETTLVATDSDPVQIFLVLKTNKIFSLCNPNSFLSKFRITQRLINKKFEVVLSSTFSSSEDDTCNDGIRSVWIAHPLRVFGLDVGTYEFVVNNTHTGSFEIKKSNILILR